MTLLALGTMLVRQAVVERFLDPSPLQPFEWLVDASPDVLTYLFTYLSVFYLSFSSFYYC